MKVYEKSGDTNTKTTLKMALAKAIELDAMLVVATTFGGVAREALELLREKGEVKRLCVVTHAYGTKKPGENAMSEELRTELLGAGARVVTAAHALSGAERGISSRMNGAYPAEIIAHALRMLSQGVKVVVEISVMALDAGAIPYGVPVVAVGGTGRGSDTAAILTPSYSHDILKTNIHEILCMPY